MGRKPNKVQKANIHGYASLDVKTAIQERAIMLNSNESQVTTAIVQNWFEAGCPPINELDTALQMVRKATANGKKVDELVIK